MIEALRTALADRYVLGPELGSGGMATVFRAEDLKHERQVAIKVLHLEHTATLAASRFLQEIRVAAQLTHPNIVSLYDSGQAEGFLFYVMPCVDGESLRQRLDRERQLSVGEALQIARELTDALSYAHERGVVHRDIKPENILLSRGHALLADFGVARAVAEAGTGLTSSGTFVGTPLYSSPEQASGSHDLDARADVYSLACVVYEMLAGEPPFTGPTVQAVLAKHALETRPRVRTVRDTVPPHVDEALVKAMARVPADRFATVAEFGATLERPIGPVPGEPVRKRGWTGRVMQPRGYVALLLIPAIALAAIWGPRLPRLLLKPAVPSYDGLPRWSQWSDVAGEAFYVVAASDSALIVHTAGTDAVYTYDGQSWTHFPIPEPFTLRPYYGRLGASRLLASRPAREPGRSEPEYWWLDLAGDSLVPRTRLPDLSAGPLLPLWWSDGESTTVWTGGLERLTGSGWVAEHTGTPTIAQLWGRDFRHRFAIADNPADSLLVYDGISWARLDILPGRSALSPVYSTGASLRDGATVVLGEACDTTVCLPLILQQDVFGGSWRQLSIPEHIGLPARQPPRPTDRCGQDRLKLAGVGGESARDYYVWGEWNRCEPGPTVRIASGCPPEWPCVWRVVDGDIQPVEDLRGRVLRAVQPVGRGLFALGVDGVVWRRVGERWRAVEQVPGLPDPEIVASALVVVRVEGDRLTYEPGGSRAQSTFTVTPLNPPGGWPGGVRAVAVRDSLLVVLAGDGSLFRSTCAIRSNEAGLGQRALACTPLARTTGSAEVRGIALLRDGTVLGLAPHEIWTWRADRLVREPLPAEARADTLWAVTAGPGERATVAGRAVLLQRDERGRWTSVAGFPPGGLSGDQLAGLPDGNVAVGGGWLRLWQHGGGRPSLRVLRQGVLGEGVVGALHALPDGRLVAGFATPEAAGVGGWLQVWAAPVSANRSEKVDLPLIVDVTSLADDGRYLLVAGRGGSMTIPLADLPFQPRAPQ